MLESIFCAYGSESITNEPLENIAECAGSDETIRLLLSSDMAESAANSVISNGGVTRELFPVANLIPNSSDNIAATTDCS